ncbi:MAG: penicillin-binding protein activator LpoB [Rickettsiales bacterium]|jgi:curli biogenesis system outer membrane secretion channel CsgG|nr:penicillin-binding protein activator LpoB [Rickettsiales bacterium]
MTKKLTIYILFLAGLVGCHSLETKRVSINESDDLASNITDEWVMKDTELSVIDILSQIRRHKGFQKYRANLARQPKLFIANIQNETSEPYFPIADLNDELLNEFSASGEYRLIDAASREKILKEMKFQKSGTVDPKQIKEIGSSSGADLLVFGDVRMDPKILGGKTIKEYSVNIRMTDILSGEEVCRTRYKISKYSKRSGSRL